MYRPIPSSSPLQRSRRLIRNMRRVDHEEDSRDLYAGPDTQFLSDEETSPFIQGNTTPYRAKTTAFSVRTYVLSTIKRYYLLGRRLVFGVEPMFAARTMTVDGRRSSPPRSSFVPNVICNTKYNVITFVPLVLYEQFRFFFNLYFLIVALSQFFPPLKVGFLFTYITPLVFVLVVTMIKEAHDDIKRYIRDREVNSQHFERLNPSTGTVEHIPSSDIQVGDILVVHTNQRAPADGIMLRTTERGGACFIRTDQLDGETDWKLRHAVPYTQSLPGGNAAVAQVDARVYAEPPKKDIYDFVGTFTASESNELHPLSLENTIWSNCVVASGSCLLMVTYTGKETRAVMNATHPRTKVGVLDMEVNKLSKVLFGVMCFLALAMVTLKGFGGLWYIYLFRFILLFSSIIPISLRVNLDMAKTVYSVRMMKDQAIPGTVVRNSGIPEELAQISYLLSDKTGTLTKNEMIFKRLHLGMTSFSVTSNRGDDGQGCLQVSEYLKVAFTTSNFCGSAESNASGASSGSAFSKSNGRSLIGMSRRDMDDLIIRDTADAVLALALCHNVSPTVDDETGARTFSASSPDEVALVRFADAVGVSLEERTTTQIVLRIKATNGLRTYEVLHAFPFTSDRKRAGILVRDVESGTICYYLKGADSVMQRIMPYADWLVEECDNMAREGLRTLVVARRIMTPGQLESWMSKLKEAQARVLDRAAALSAVADSLEVDMKALCVTGVEDKLQTAVADTLEALRDGGIRVWMLTGDKVETAICIARSSKLTTRSQHMVLVTHANVLRDIRQSHSPNMQSPGAGIVAAASLSNMFLVIEGSLLEQIIHDYLDVLLQVAAVAVCRCSPTQKAMIATALKNCHSPARVRGAVCAIGDGGNDVSMITAADIGIGLAGKEGRQASLAADVSLTQFSFLKQLLLLHGRRSYKNSARLAQFVIHRGLIISIIQCVFSALFYYAAVPIYTGMLMVGYATYYTMLPVFCIVIDEDVTEETALTYPELYAELRKGRSLNMRTFWTWVFKAVYQGASIMVLCCIFFSMSLLKIVSISFSALVLTELSMLMVEVHTINRFVISSVLTSLLIYAVSVAALPTYFDQQFMMTLGFWWRVIIITAASVVPVSIAKVVHRHINPPTYAKLQSAV